MKEGVSLSIKAEIFGQGGNCWLKNYILKKGGK